MSSELSSGTRNRIAVVGMACRLPGAQDVETYWENLRSGKESIARQSDEALLAAGVSRRSLADADYVKAASVVEDVDKFDASFFYLSARDAEKMDPQLRVFLECAWEALERSGTNSERFDGAIGVFAGSLFSTYLLWNLYTNPASLNGSIEAFMRDLPARMGNDSNYLATRTSYHLNLTGPSVSVQTACSTSLVAVHLACQSLLSGECDMALAGGVSIRFPQQAGYHYQRDGIVSPDGHCRPFDAAAQGTVFGNGAGVAVLKRLEDAIADRDPILAVILGSAMGNDGSNKVGYAAPGLKGQAEVIAEALAVAGVDPDSVTYVEAHGTGTAMGDPIEVAALAQAYPRSPAPCTLGSVKGNLGHLSIAAGVAGLIKTILMLKHREIPPTLHFTTPNPECGFESTRFQVNRELVGWRGDGRPLRAGLSSFGMGGTNVHLILEEPPSREASGPSRPFKLLPLSAKSPAALEVATQNAIRFLRDTPGVDLADVSYTYALGRRTFNYRSLVVAQDAAGAAHALETHDPGQILTGSGQPESRPVVFMFPGQGAQAPSMGADCYAHEGVYRASVDECAEILRPILGYDLREVLYPQARGQGAAKDLHRTELTQPALFVVELALAKLWMSWGVRPAAMIGHSVGEYVAAHLAGVFSLEDALRLIAERGRLVQALPAGAMAAVALPPEQLSELLIEGVAIAAINEPSLCSISGPPDRVAELTQRLADRGIASRPLKTSHAFHSDMMAPAQAQFREIARQARLRPMQIPFISNVTGTWITEAQATDPGYWADHLREPVQFAEGARRLLEDAKRVFLEVGPGETLATFVRRHPSRESGQAVMSSLGRSGGKGKEHANLLTAVGRLWTLGQDVDWEAFYRGEQRSRVALPTYPFERTRYWVEPEPRGAARPPETSATAEKLQLDDWFYVPVWRQSRLPVDAREEETSASTGAGSWLVFADSCGVAAALAARLAEGAAQITTVVPGAGYEQISDGAYRIAPAEEEDYRRMIRSLVASGRAPGRILHAWSVSRADGEAPSIERFERTQSLGLYSLLGLTKALVAEGVTSDVQIDALTSNVHLVTGEEPLDADKATVTVACKVIPQEHTNLRCRSIDVLVPEAASRAQELLTDQLLKELRAPLRPELGIAYRGRTRWVQGFERLEHVVEPSRGSRLRERGVYLITGGLGQIGTAIAEMLATRVGARLALLVREELPPRDAWDAWLASHDAANEIGQRIRNAKKLEALGAEVLVLSADVADAAQMSRAISQIDARFGALNGVIHAAGLPGEKWDRTVMNTSVEECRWHFNAKAHGPIVLERVLGDRPVDFCLFLSSLAGVLGGLRLLAYGSANHFMDAMARRVNRALGRSAWISVDWDVWQHHQEEKRAASGLGKVMDDKAILPEEGLSAIRRVLSLDDVAQVAVSTWELSLRVDQWIRLEDPSKAKREKANGSPAAAPHERPSLASTFISPGSELEQAIAAMLAEALGIDRIGMADEIFDLGGDSLFAVRILSQVRTRYGIDVPLAEFLSEPTARGLSRLVEERLAGRTDIDAVLAKMAQHDPREVLRLLEEVERLSPEAAAAASRELVH